MNDDSQSSSNDACDLRTSTVMPAARRRPSLEVLVDDLHIRLRCLSPVSTQGGRLYPLWGLADEPQLRALFREAKVWWLTNELSELDSESRRWLVYEIFQRSPADAAILALALLGAIAFPELCLTDIETMESWFNGMPAPARNIRDALVLRVWLPWFLSRPSNVVDIKLRKWLRSNPLLVRAALVLCVGLVQESPASESRSCTWVLGELTQMVQYRDREVASAIGWFASIL